MPDTPADNEEPTPRLARILQRVAGPVLMVAVALLAVEFGLWRGSQHSGSNDYGRYYKSGFSAGYDRSVRSSAGAADHSQGTWRCNEVILDPRDARRDIQLRAYDLGTYGDVTVRTGWCIIKVAVVPDSGPDDYIAGHVPGCAYIEDYCQMLHSYEYAGLPDGIWCR